MKRIARVNETQSNARVAHRYSHRFYPVYVHYPCDYRIYNMIIRLFDCIEWHETVAIGVYGAIGDERRQANDDNFHIFVAVEQKSDESETKKACVTIIYL